MSRKQDLNQMRRATKKGTSHVEKAKRRLKNNGYRKPNQNRTAKRNRRRVSVSPQGERKGGDLDPLPPNAEDKPSEDTGGEGLVQGLGLDSAIGLGGQQPSVIAGSGNRPVLRGAVGEISRFINEEEKAYIKRMYPGTTDKDMIGWRTTVRTPHVISKMELLK